MATKKTAETKKEFNMEQAFAMWKQKSKSGTDYFTGTAFDKKKLVGFYNGKKKNPKEPDIRIYGIDGEGKAESEEFVSLWVNVSKSGKKYLSGKLDKKKIVGFINDKSKNAKAPYFSCYYSESTPKKQEEEAFTDASSEEVPF